MALAIENLSDVWNSKQPAASRYSDGSYPVLYTAADQGTAEAERCHWTVELVFKSGTADRVNGYLLYRCEVNATCLDRMPDWKSDPRLVHPDDYTYCQSIARGALKSRIDCLRVPSARKFDGVCVPVLKSSAARVVDVMSAFDILWDAARMVPRIDDGHNQRTVTIDAVFQMVGPARSSPS